MFFANINWEIYERSSYTWAGPGGGWNQQITPLAHSIQPCEVISYSPVLQSPLHNTKGNNSSKLFRADWKSEIFT